MLRCHPGNPGLAEILKRHTDFADLQANGDITCEQKGDPLGILTCRLGHHRQKLEFDTAEITVQASILNCIDMIDTQNRLAKGEACGIAGVGETLPLETVERRKEPAFSSQVGHLSKGDQSILQAGCDHLQIVRIHRPQTKVFACWHTIVTRGFFVSVHSFIRSITAPHRRSFSSTFS